MNLNIKRLACAVGMALGLAATGPASAAVSWSFEDDDIDYILDATTLAPITSGTLQVGQVFVSVFEVPTFTKNGVSSIPAGQELTGIAAVQLVAIIPVVAGAPLSLPGTQYIYRPYAGGLDAILAVAGAGTTVPGGAGGQGAAIAMWLNGTSGAGGDRDLELNRSILPETNCTSLADCVGQASLGSLFQVDGFGIDPDDFWAATSVVNGANDIGTVLNTNNNVIVAAINAGLSTFYNRDGQVHYVDIATGNYCGNPGPIADGCVQASFSGTLTGGQGLVTVGGHNGAVAHSDFDGQKYVVPEPASLALMGIALAGLGALRRRRD